VDDEPSSLTRCLEEPVTTAADNRIEVVDVPAQSRFVVRGVDGEAELVYERAGDRLLLLHTEVPDQLSGHGLGGRLVGAAVDQARAESLTLVPWCPFARRWLHQHPDALHGVGVDWKSQPLPR
jgi:uncharacterized protein